MKKLRFLGLFPLLLMAFLLWLAVSWFATDVFLNFRVKAHIQEEISGVEKQTIRVAEGLSNKLSDIHGVLTLVARDADVLRALSRFQSDVRPSSLPINQRKSIWSEDAQLKKVDDYLKLVNTEMKDDVVYLINTAGDCVAASNMEKPESFVGTNYLSREYFKEAMKGRRGYQYAMGKVSNIPGLFFSVPVVDEGRLVGVLVAKRTLHSLMRPISHANTFIVDQFGVIILASEKRYEMRSLPGASVAALSREARLERYKREDFPVLTVSPWRDRWGSSLLRFEQENQALVLVAQHVWDGALQIQSYERLSKIGKLESERNYQLFLLSLLGILVALFTSACIIIVRQRRQSHNAIQTSELRHRLLFESSRDALLTLTPPLWQVTEANQAALQLFKASSMAQFAAIGLGDSAPRTQPDGRLSMEKAREVIATVLKTGHCSFEWQHLRLDGQPFTASVTVSKMETGAAPFLLVNVRDITESKKVEAEIRIAATAFESHEAMIITDANAVILRANRAYCEASGYTAEEIVGQNPKLFQSGRHDEHFYHELWDALVRTGFWEGEIWDRRKDGETYPKWLTITAVRGAEGEVTHYVGAHIDISERKQTEEKVREMAFTDQLTGLPNRRLLMDRLKHALHVSRRNTSHGAVLFLDLNKFKQLNDTHGHEAGDMLLAEVGRRLKLAIRQVDTVARLGGDEFVVLLEDLGPDASVATDCAARVTEKIRQSLVQEYVIGELSYHCSASIGITIFMGDEVDCDQILKEADASMYKQKKNRD